MNQAPITNCELQLIKKEKRKVKSIVPETKADLPNRAKWANALGPESSRLTLCQQL